MFTAYDKEQLEKPVASFVFRKTSDSQTVIYRVMRDVVYAPTPDKPKTYTATVFYHRKGFTV